MDKDTEHFDCIAIGSGAGKLVPWLLSSQHGKKCAVIERKYVGGSCPNIACLPSKHVLHAANLAHGARMVDRHGLDIPNPEKLKSDMKVVKKAKTEMLETVNGFRDLFKAFNVEVINAEGRFESPKVVQTSTGRRLTADNIIISTGSRAKIDDHIPGLVEAKPMTHVEILELDVLPSHLIVVGGGYIGVEFAQAYRRFGAEVTIVQRGPQLLRGEDEDVVECLASVLQKEGIRVLTDTSIASVDGKNGDGVTVSIKSTNGSNDTLRGSHILVAAGRAPNTETLDLGKAGVTTTAAGHIAVNEQLQTNVANIWSCGDCANSPHFTHIGWDDHRVILNNILGSPRTNGTSGRLVPSVLFTNPELAHVGLREKEARAQGIEFRLVKAGMAAFLRTHTLDKGDTAGFAKALLAKESDQILGFTALGPGTGEILPVISLAMTNGLGVQAIRNLTIVHPTLNEGLLSMFMGELPMQGAKA